MPAAVPIVLGVASVASAAVGANAAKKAGKAQARSADAAVDEQRRQFDTALQLTEGQRFTGNQANNALAQMLGLPQFNYQQADLNRGIGANGEALNSLVGDTELPIEGRRIVARDKNNFDVFYGDQNVGQLVRGGGNGRFIGNGAEIPKTQMQPTGTPGGMAPNGAGAGNALAAFQASPDYQFRRDEGNRDIAQSFAARGGAQSGNALRALTQYNSNLASGEFSERFNRLASLAGLGQTASQQGANNAINTGRGVASSLQDAGAARASGVAGAGAAYAGGISDLAGTLAFFNGNRGQPMSGANYNSLSRFRGLGGV